MVVLFWANLQQQQTHAGIFIMTNLDHEAFMRRAIALSQNAPDLPFGCVIVNRATGAIVAEGWNRSKLQPTWHGEIDAINNLVKSQPDFDGNALVLYSTAEPCPMCQAAVLWSGLSGVVFGTSIRTLIRLGWKQIDIPAEDVVRRATKGWTCTIVGGVLEEECDALFAKAIRQQE